MALVKNNLVIEDVWTFVDDEAALPEGDVVVSLTRWKNERDQLVSRAENIGILLQSDENPEEIASDIEVFQLIALNYPAFTDGRAYSYARLLRERYGYEGELRATGNVLRDQVFLMHRCGFDSFEIKAEDEKALQIWLDAQKEMTNFYQPTGDGRKTVSSLRQRRRMAKKAG